MGICIHDCTCTCPYNPVYIYIYYLYVDTFHAYVYIYIYVTQYVSRVFPICADVMIRYVLQTARLVLKRVIQKCDDHDSCFQDIFSADIRLIGLTCSRTSKEKDDIYHRHRQLFLTSAVITSVCLVLFQSSFR